MTSRKTKATERNTRASQILIDLFEQSLQGHYKIDGSFDRDIEVLFETQDWGLREIVLVICVARLLDMNFKASENFYACHPRSLYEKPIKSELDQRGIPNRQSGPLNVAKGARGINDQWAAGRKSPQIAQLVVSIVQQIEQMTKDKLENFTKLLLNRFLEEASIVEQLNVRSEPNAEPKFLYEVCEFLIKNAADSGNTPQRIVGYLLESYHEDLQTGVVVSGHTDRASTTSTTSKKLGDITEERINGVMASAYEVTVKKFGPQRVREAYEAAKAYSVEEASNTCEIIVICRKQDLHPAVQPVSNIYLGKLEYQDMVFHFVEIFEWIIAQLLRLSADGRLSFFTQLQRYVHDKNTSSSVKLAWSEIIKSSYSYLAPPS